MVVVLVEEKTWVKVIALVIMVVAALGVITEALVTVIGKKETWLKVVAVVIMVVMTKVLVVVIAVDYYRQQRVMILMIDGEGDDGKGSG